MTNQIFNIKTLKPQASDFIKIKGDKIISFKKVYVHKLSQFANPLNEHLEITFKNADEKIIKITTPNVRAQNFMTKSVDMPEINIIASASRNDEHLIDVNKVEQYLSVQHPKNAVLPHFATLSIDLAFPEGDLIFYAPNKFYKKPEFKEDFALLKEFEQNFANDSEVLKLQQQINTWQTQLKNVDKQTRRELLNNITNAQFDLEDLRAQKLQDFDIMTQDYEFKGLQKQALLVPKKHDLDSEYPNITLPLVTFDIPKHKKTDVLLTSALIVNDKKMLPLDLVLKDPQKFNIKTTNVSNSNPQLNPEFEF